MQHNESFIHQPYICGALGPDNLNLWKSLLSNSPTRLLESQRGATHRFASSRSHGLEAIGSGWAWGRYTARKLSPSSIAEASLDLGLAGFVGSDNNWTLFTDGLGSQPLYYRTLGATYYFANRIAPLALIGPQLHINKGGWMSTFHLRMFSGENTPFAEIRRLLPGQRIILNDGAICLDESLADWLTSPNMKASLSDVQEALQDACPGEAREGLDLTLSGGLDSRLLLATLLKNGANDRIRTWSTDHEDGNDADTRIAHQIATSIGLPWTHVQYNIEAWLSAHQSVARRLEHLTTYHAWYMPLAERLRQYHGPVLDGLAGDVLFRYSNEKPLRDDSARINAIWDQLGGDRASKEGVLNSSLIDAWNPTLFLRWKEDQSRWLDHPHGESIIRLFTRTLPGISAAPTRIFGPERSVITPFLDPLVVKAALNTHLGGTDIIDDVRPQLIASLCPELSQYGSTAFRSEPRTWVERGRTDRNTADCFIRAISNSPLVSSLFDGGILQPSASMERVRTNVSFALRIGAIMADWVDIWRPRLNSLDLEPRSWFDIAHFS